MCVNKRPKIREAHLLERSRQKYISQIQISHIKDILSQLSSSISKFVNIHFHVLF